ncbi:MAG: 5-methyltetrahydropteroyltriglutamate--homocysteine S-methyltransferase [Bacteroidales bacterium]|nr:5-methyltetrahydropteroyltriglutamate--homocysteine S-methyltransferase [Bacteroidales bacterium]MCF8333749.1 5-methyltetrahydropteroyltriglutamate--homocysteine S-methyltransferase [Bacteroidales bacterium]
MMINTHVLGYPRIGAKRETKKVCERYWADKVNLQDLIDTGKEQRRYNWQVQKEAGIDLVPVNDFSYYDHILDTSLMVGAIPERFQDLKHLGLYDLYFAMARGYQKEGKDLIPVEMTKWFDTNYHYLVPEFYKNQKFEYYSRKAVEEFKEAKEFGVNPKPVLTGPVTYLLLGKEKEEGFDRLDLVDALLDVYAQILKDLRNEGAEWVQFDEPFLVQDLTEKQKSVYKEVYKKLREGFPSMKFMLATYFEGLYDNLNLAVSLPVDALHLDLVRDPAQLDDVLKEAPDSLTLSLGLVDGRSIWRNNYEQSLKYIEKAKLKKNDDKLMISASSSLLHVPYDLDLEDDEKNLPPEIKNWMAFAKQKLNEIGTLANLADPVKAREVEHLFEENKQAIESKKNSDLIHRKSVRKRMSSIDKDSMSRSSDFADRQKKQVEELKLPEFPTTTIGSFPQTKDIRQLRRQYKKNEISKEEYEQQLKQKTKEVIRKQEEAGLDVLVHGEFERNDMVEYFGEQLEGFVFTKNGWVQSYGSRGVKPPIIFGDVEREEPMTVDWSSYAQSITDRKVKGMLTGPVTILQWSFIRNDQPRKDTAFQLALAIRDEVVDLEKAGIKLIQIDEPAFREGLPLRKKDRNEYLDWAVKAFRLASSGVKDHTQIHTHMCYSEFNNIMKNIAELDADVITIEASRSQMELLEAFGDYEYPNEIGPGVYDIHSPRVPSQEEVEDLLQKAARVIPKRNLWVNPDCGLKTRKWDETWPSLENMVKAAKKLRKKGEGATA